AIPEAPKVFDLPYVPPPLPPEFTPDIQSKAIGLQSCKSKGTLPTRDALRARMEVAGLVNGVAVKEECVGLMEQALATYLKDIISGIRERIRPQINDSFVGLGALEAQPAPPPSHGQLSQPTIPPIPIPGPSSTHPSSAFHFPLSLLRSPATDNIRIRGSSSSPSVPLLPTATSSLLPAEAHADHAPGRPGGPPPPATTPVGVEDEEARRRRKGGVRENHPSVSGGDVAFVGRITPALLMRAPNSADVVERLVGSLAALRGGDSGGGGSGGDSDSEGDYDSDRRALRA
ncbi:hypothetical protein HK405_004052, partial [Cladochytrium tenue]